MLNQDLFYFLSVYAATNIVTAISCFSPLLNLKTISSLVTLFILLCRTYAHGGKVKRCYWIPIPSLCHPVYIFVKYLQPQNYTFIRTIHFFFKIEIRYINLWLLNFMKTKVLALCTLLSLPSVERNIFLATI